MVRRFLLAVVFLLSAPLARAQSITIQNLTGSAVTNAPISVGQPFKKGDITNYPQASIAGTLVLTQADVKNRWPDGSVKFAIVSFILPSLASNAGVTVTWANQSTGNNTGYLSQPAMLGSGYNFDGQIQLTGTASHNISARAILTAAGACANPGAGGLDQSSFECSYWLQGPIVTAVILEDRLGRSFDVNTDGGSGNPLHPIFEAWFYPQGNLVQLGYTLEDSWASTTAANSARDQTYSLVLTGGNTAPATEYSNGSFTEITRSRWHKTFCVNGAGAGQANRCGPLLHVDHNWGYWATTKFLPHWDTTLQIANSKIASEYSGLLSGGVPPIQGNSSGVAYFPKGLNAPGSAEFHGPLTTWDIIYLMSQCDAGNSTATGCGNGSGGDMESVMLANADLGGRIPYFFREADNGAGHGQYFDAPSDHYGTQGRVISINARTQISLDAVANTVGQCNVNYSADYINFGGGGEDTDSWDTDTSHWPNLAYASYLTTGQYAYYEEQMMQSAYAIADSPGTRACYYGTASSRGAALGYWQADQERQQDWTARENAIGAFIAVDSTPEKAYFTDKLSGNLAVWEGSHGIGCDIPGTGVQEPYCGSSGSYYAEGTTVRTGVPWSGTTLGSWTAGICSGPQNCYVANAPLNQSGPNVPASANSNFMNAYSALIIGWVNDFGFCPGSCAMLQYVANRYINVALNPAANKYDLQDYVYPTLDASGNQITSWTENQTFYAGHDSGWFPCSGISIDEGYGQEGMAILAYAYGLTSGGYSGAAAYNAVRSTIGCINNSPGNDFASGSPKWDITPENAGGIPSGIGWSDLGSATQLQGAAQDTCPPNGYGGDPYQFDSNCRNVEAAWSGAAMDQKRQRLIIFGGGHADYFGNELYSVNLASSPVTLTRLDNPTVPTNYGDASISPVIPLSCTNFSNCFPNSRHSYGGLSYLENTDQMLVFGGGAAGNAGGYTIDTWLLDMGTLTWHQEHGTGVPNFSDVPMTAYDVNTGRTYMVNSGGNFFGYYNYSGDSWVTLNNNASVQIYESAVVDSTNKLFVAIGGGDIYWFDISGNDPTYAQHTITSASGCSAIIGLSYSGVAYDEVGKQIVIWPNGGGTVYFLNTNTWTCTSQTFSGGPGSGEANGTHGRFRYVRAQDAFVLAATPDQDVWGLRLRAGSGPPPPPPPPPQPEPPSGLAATVR